MIRSIGFLFFAGIQVATHAQVSDISLATIHYDVTYVSDTTRPESRDKDETVLFIGKKSSLYTSYFQMISEKRSQAYLAQHPEIQVSGATYNYGVPNTFYKGMAEDKLYSIASFKGNKYILEEKTPAIDWKITDETKIINGYNCQKATTLFRGRTYDAWFALQLPFSAGPWKLAGLPGLILEAYDTKKEYLFSFKSFENPDTLQTVIELPVNTIKTTKKELYSSILAVQNGATVGAATGSLMGPQAGNGQSRRKQFNNPLEKEQ